MAMTLRLLGSTLAVFALVAPSVASAGSAELRTDRGVVQSVDSTQIILRALDGSVVSYPLSAITRVKLNGLRTTIDEIKPGYVAAVIHDGAAPAVLVRAFGKPSIITDRGVVTALSKTSITVRTNAGVLVTVSLDASTRFQFLGLPTRRFVARSGAVVAVRHPDGAPARVVNVLKRAGA